MRDYGKVAPQFWTGQTGKALKAAGPEAVIVAMYLMTSPHANMIGLYYLPKLYIAHETGLDIEGACKGLARAIEAGFCSYGEASEHVFVHAMARFQIADQLSANDKRCKGVENELAKCPDAALALTFRRLYSTAFNLAPAVESEAPPKPLRSQEQEQEQEQEEKILSSGDDGLPAEPKPKQPAIPYDDILAAYHEALPMLPAVRLLTDARRKKIKSRWHELAERQTVEYWRGFFAYAAKSDFLTGRNGKWTACNFDWLLEPSNHLKVAEGNYENGSRS